MKSLHQLSDTQLKQGVTRSKTILILASVSVGLLVLLGILVGVTSLGHSDDHDTIQTQYSQIQQSLTELITFSKTDALGITTFPCTTVTDYCNQTDSPNLIKTDHMLGGSPIELQIIPDGDPCPSDSTSFDFDFTIKDDPFFEGATLTGTCESENAVGTVHLPARTELVTRALAQRSTLRSLQQTHSIRRLAFSKNKYKVKCTLYSDRLVHYTGPKDAKTPNPCGTGIYVDENNAGVTTWDTFGHEKNSDCRPKDSLDPKVCAPILRDALNGRVGNNHYIVDDDNSLYRKSTDGENMCTVPSSSFAIEWVPC